MMSSTLQQQQQQRQQQQQQKGGCTGGLLLTSGVGQAGRREGAHRVQQPPGDAPAADGGRRQCLGSAWQEPGSQTFTMAASSVGEA